MVKTTNYLILVLTGLIVGCSIQSTKPHNANQYKIYHPDCTRFSQAISMPDQLNSIEWQEKLDIAKSCKALGY